MAEKKLKTTVTKVQPKADKGVVEEVEKMTEKKVIKETDIVKKTIKVSRPTIKVSETTKRSETPEKSIKSSLKTGKKETNLEVAVYDVKGKSTETMSLPKEIFGMKVNRILMAQAVRIYLANQRQGNASTKTRGEVTGSTRKIYQQKGTGRARHGGIRAPIFVHGGIAHGPKLQDHSLKLPRKMKRAALGSALSAQMQDNNIKVIQELGSIEAKTKTMVKLLHSIGIKNEKVLLILPGNVENVYKAARNIPNVSVTASDRLNTYEVLNNPTLLFMLEAIESLQKHFGKEKTAHE